MEDSVSLAARRSAMKRIRPARRTSKKRRRRSPRRSGGSLSRCSRTLRRCVTPSYFMLPCLGVVGYPLSLNLARRCFHGVACTDRPWRARGALFRKRAFEVFFMHGCLYAYMCGGGGGGGGHGRQIVCHAQEDGSSCLPLGPGLIQPLHRTHTHTHTHTARHTPRICLAQHATPCYTTRLYPLLRTAPYERGDSSGYTRYPKSYCGHYPHSVFLPSLRIPLIHPWLNVHPCRKRHRWI